MATIKLVPSTYYLSNSNYLSVSNASNMYDDTDSTNYATVTNSRTSTSSYYIYIRGFNFDDVPSNAIVSDFTIRIKCNYSGQILFLALLLHMNLLVIIVGVTQLRQGLILVLELTVVDLQEILHLTFIFMVQKLKLFIQFQLPVQLLLL